MVSQSTGTTSGCKVNFIYNLYQQPELILGHNGQLTIVANVEELWVVFQLLLLAFVVVRDQRLCLRDITRYSTGRDVHTTWPQTRDEWSA